MKKVIFILMALILLIPAAVLADSPLPPDMPVPPSLPLMIEGTAPEGLVTVEINGEVQEVVSDGKFYIPLSGKVGDIITFTMGDIVVTETYIDPMVTPAIYVTLTEPVEAPTIVDVHHHVEPTVGDIPYDEVNTIVRVSAFTEEDIAWIIAHGGYIY